MRFEGVVLRCVTSKFIVCFVGPSGVSPGKGCFQGAILRGKCGTSFLRKVYF